MRFKIVGSLVINQRYPRINKRLVQSLTHLGSFSHHIFALIFQVQILIYSKRLKCRSTSTVGTTW